MDRLNPRLTEKELKEYQALDDDINLLNDEIEKIHSKIKRIKSQQIFIIKDPRIDEIMSLHNNISEADKVFYNICHNPRMHLTNVRVTVPWSESDQIVIQYEDRSYTVEIMKNWEESWHRVIKNYLRLNTDKNNGSWKHSIEQIINQIYYRHKHRRGV